MTQGSAKDAGKRASVGTMLAALVALQSLTLLLLVGMAAFNDVRIAKRHALAASQHIAEVGADLVGDQLTAIATSFASQSSNPGFAAVFAAPSTCRLSGATTGVFTQVDVHLVRPDGTIVCSSAQPTGDYRAAGWLGRATASPAPFTEGPAPDPASGKPVVLVVTPLTSVRGTFVAAVHTDGVADALRARLSTRDARAAFVVTTADRRSTLSAQGLRAATGVFARPFDRERVEFADPSGTDRIWGAQDVEGIGWHVFAGVSTDDALRPVQIALLRRIAFAIASLLVVIGTGWLIRRRIVRPMADLSHVVRRAAAGALPQRVREDGPSEIASLAHDVNGLLQTRAEAESALRHALERERDAAGRLRELDRLKSSFLDAVSHELRTPLTTVLGFTETLRVKGESMSARQVVDAASRAAGQARKLDMLVGNLLDLKSLTSNLIETSPAVTDAASVVREVALGHDLGGRPIDVNALPLNLSVDAGVVRHIVRHLLSNVVRHTPDGTPVRISVERKDGGLLLVIEDDGPGIADDLKRAVFEPFRHGNDSSATPGAGIGLSLVAKFARLVGGKVWVEDAPSGGASFHVQIPEHAAAAADV